MALFLIIEPDDDIRRLYAAVVRGLGHEPVFPDSGSIAEPHVILVEPAHPASFEAAQQLRHDYPAVPIVCASIYEPTHEQAQLLHATTYLLKPFSLVELTNALQAALRNLTLCPSS